LQRLSELPIADVTARQSLDKCIDFGPSSTHWKDSFPLSLLYLRVIGEVNHHFTSLVNGVFSGFGSINLRYRNPAPILVANPNISEREWLLTVFRLSVGLPSDRRSGPRISARVRTGYLVRGRILLARRRGLPSLCTPSFMASATAGLIGTIVGSDIASAMDFSRCQTSGGCPFR